MYNQETGQVYDEYVLPPPPPTYVAGRDWSRRTDLPPWKGRGGPGRKGARTLAEMSMHVLVENIGFLSEEHFSSQALPLRYIWRIWRLLENRGTCLQAWKVLSKLLLADDGEKTLSLYRYRHHICRPTEPLSHYILPLQSPTFDFLSYLNISGFCSFDTSELLALSDLKNLAVLEIIQPSDEMRAVFPRVSDRLIRGWSEKDNPFPLLRILRLWGDEAVTQHSLSYLSKFPSLRLYDVNGARSDWANAATFASASGWKMAEPLHGLQDSFLWYLMLFASLEEENPKKLRDLARNMDEGLTNFCLNNSQPVAFVDPEASPQFMDYVSEAARSNLPLYLDGPSYDSQTCKGFPFEVWAFFLCTFLGQLIGDEDLKKNGVKIDKQAVSNSLILPSRPLACLQLGHSGRAGMSPSVAYMSRGLFATSRYTFFRTGPRDKGDVGDESQKTREASDFMKPQPQLSNVETGRPETKSPETASHGRSARVVHEILSL